MIVTTNCAPPPGRKSSAMNDRRPRCLTGALIVHASWSSWASDIASESAWNARVRRKAMSRALWTVPPWGRLSPAPTAWTTLRVAKQPLVACFHSPDGDVWSSFRLSDGPFSIIRTRPGGPPLEYQETCIKQTALWRARQQHRSLQPDTLISLRLAGVAGIGKYSPLLYRQRPG